MEKQQIRANRSFFHYLQHTPEENLLVWPLYLDDFFLLICQFSIDLAKGQIQVFSLKLRATRFTLMQRLRESSLVQDERHSYLGFVLSTQTQLSLFTDFFWQWLQPDVENCKLLFSQVGALPLFPQPRKLNMNHFSVFLSCDGNST